MKNIISVYKFSKVLSVCHHISVLIIIFCLLLLTLSEKNRHLSEDVNDNDCLFCCETQEMP